MNGNSIASSYQLEGGGINVRDYSQHNKRKKCNIRKKTKERDKCKKRASEMENGLEGVGGEKFHETSEGTRKTTSSEGR